MNKLIAISTLTVMILTISCTKEVSKNEVYQGRQSAITQRLLEFKQSSMLKNDASYHCDSAIWYLEGILNLENAVNTHSFEDVIFYHDTINLVVNNDSIQSADYSAIYNEITAWLNSILVDSNANVNFDFIDISLLEESFKSTSTQLVVSTSAGELTATTIMNYVPFSQIDFWNWAWGEGKCGDFSGQAMGKDATTELQRKFTHPVSQPTAGYFVSVEDRTVMAFEYEENNPYSGYMMFYAGGSGSGPGVGPCLSPEELNYYLSKFDFIKTDQCPNGKEFKTVEVEPTISTGIGYWDYLHQYNLYYGIKVPQVIIDL